MKQFYLSLLAMCFVFGLSAQSQQIVVQVSNPLDDLEEYADVPGQTNTPGNVDEGSSDLELGSESDDGSEPQIVGIRFASVNIPAGSIITGASIQFTVDETKGNDTQSDLTISAQADANPSTFANTPFDISSRPTFGSTIDWMIMPGTWGTVGEAGPNQATPDVSSLVQAIIDQDGWEEGNPMVFIFEGTGTKAAESYDGDPTAAATITIDYIPATAISTLDIAVGMGSDDMEEYADVPGQTNTPGAIDEGSSDLELGSESADGSEPQVVGVRFGGVDIPAGSVIVDARIQFTVDETKGNDTDSELTIFAEANANPETYNTDAFNISSRETLASTVDWSIAMGTWGTVGEAGENQRTPNIAALVQALIDQDGWEAGNAMAFQFSGTGTKAAESYDGDATAAPRLIVDFVPAATPQSFGVSVSASEDDMEQYADVPGQTNTPGAIDPGSSDLELGSESADGSEPQIVGVRFANVEIPAGAVITSASIQFTVDETKGNDTDSELTIFAEANTNPDSYTTDAFSISSRETLPTTVAWSIPMGTWGTVGEAGENQRTPDLAALVQSLVSQDGWEAGNAMAFQFSGTGTKAAESYDGDPTAAPTLNVEYFMTEEIRNRISAPEDDIEEYIAGANQTQTPGSFDSGSSDLELGSEDGDGTDPQLVGLRFASVDVDATDEVTAAYIQFTVDESKNTDEGQFIIRAQMDANPSSFEEVENTVSSRPTFTETVSWTVPANTWTTAGESGPDQRTADITELINLIIAQDGWAAGNAMVFTVEGTNTKVAESFEGDATAAAELVISVIADQEAQPIEVVDFGFGPGSDWSYFDEGTIPDSWETVDFDDSAWPFGPAVLGYLDFSIVTPTAENAANVALFRKPFTVSSLNNLTENVALKLRADDYAEVTLNGELIFVTDVDAIVDGIDELEYVTYEIPRSAFVEGENVIAIGILDNDGTDLIFDAYFENIVPVFDENTEFELVQIGTYNTGVFDEGAAEIVAYNAGTSQIFYTNADANTIGVLDITDPINPTLVNEIDCSPYGGGVNSVTVFDGLVAVAVEADVAQDNGSVVFFDTDGNFINQVTVGPLPDMITFNNAGTQVLTANEGEPNDDYDVDPEGSVSIIDVSAGAANATVNTVDFTAFNANIDALRAAGVRIFGPGATVAQDLEPEFIAISDDDNIAYASCQENNALVVIDLTTETATAVLPLGFKDHSATGNGFDASNESTGIDISTRPTLGMYQPDAIKYISIGGQGYLVTANEGDARDYDGYSEESRVKDLVLDPTAYPNAAELQEDENLGRLLSTTATGDTDGDGDIDQIYSYGARSFTIWNATTGAVVFDSGDGFEQHLAEFNPLYFNANNDNNTLKNRSDDKGPEPEAIEVVEREGQFYALIGIERVGGIFVYNITDPANAYFVNYVNNRNFEADVTTPEAGDLGVEDIIYIDPADSPNGEALVVTANEVSGTVTIFGAADASNVAPDFTLRIIHNNDGESKLEPSEVGGFLVGGAAPFKTVVDQLKGVNIPTITLSSGDNFLAGISFNASLNRADGLPYYDAEVLDAIGYDGIAIGNHDFDFGPDVLEKMITDQLSGTPYISANLDFTAEPGLQALVDVDRIVKSTIVDIDGEQVGIVGLTTDLLPTISSPRNVTVDSDFLGIAQNEIDMLKNEGVNKIILITHLQSINNETALAQQLTDVDVIIAGGGDELLANNPNVAIPGLAVTGPYPLKVADANGDSTLIVTTPGEYRYVGNLVIEFDGEGKVKNIDEESDPILVVDYAPDPDLQVNVIDSIGIYAESLEDNIIAITEPALDGRRPSVRTIETNQGNLIADAFLWLGQNNAEAFGFDDLPLVAVQNGGGIRNDEIIPAGSEISERKTIDMLPFPNAVTVLNPLTPTEMQTALENAVSNVPNVDGRFLQIAGFEIVWDTTDVAEGNRIFSAILDDGTVLIDNYMVQAGAPDVYVVTNSFTAGGGDSFFVFEEAGIFANIGASYQRALYDYLVDGLDGLITAEQYPEGGEGRIQKLIIDAIEELDLLDLDMTIAPNPFRGQMRLDYELERNAEVAIRLFDSFGRVVNTYVNESQIAGEHTVSIDESNLPNGVYFVTMQVDGKIASFRVVKQ